MSLWEQFETRMTNPLFLAGGALATGEGFAGAQRGAALGFDFAKNKRARQIEADRDAFLQGIGTDPRFKAVDPGLVALAQASRDPTEVAQQLAKHRDYLLDKARTDAQVRSMGASAAATMGAERRANAMHTPQLTVAQAQAREADNPMLAYQRRAELGEKYGVPDDARTRFTLTGQYETTDPYIKFGPDDRLFNRRTQQVVGGDSDMQESRFNREWSKEAPKLFTEASKSYAAARDASTLAADMEALAPHINSGSWAGATTATQKFLNTWAPGVNFDKVGPTELFTSFAQKYVGAEGQKLKPLSNSDITFIERGLPNIQKDPSSIPLILKAMRSASEREALFKELEMRALRTGQPPDYARIVATVNETKPSFAVTHAAELAKRTPTPTTQRPPGYGVNRNDGQPPRRWRYNPDTGALE